jgi:hypothetical protein
MGERGIAEDKAEREAYDKSTFIDFLLHCDKHNDKENLMMGLW